MKTRSRRQQRTRAERDALVEQYLPLVQYVVARLPVTMPAAIDRDDFLSVGAIGLLHAATTYDETRGASFKTFAYTAIRGSILDEIRRLDPIPRSRRRRLRDIDRAAAELRQELTRQPTVEEIAQHLGVGDREMDEDLLALHTCRTLSLDAEFVTSNQGNSLGSSLASVVELDPADHAERLDQLRQLADAVAELPDPDRQVVVLYHYEDLFLREIGQLLGVTESRVCQVLARAQARLQLRMRV